MPPFWGYIGGMDLRSRIPSIRALQRQLGLGSYDKLRLVITGKRQAGPKLAMRIEEATNGAIRRWELRPDLWSPSDLVA